MAEQKEIDLCDYTPTKGPWYLQDMRDFGSDEINIMSRDSEGISFVVAKVSDPVIEIPTLDLAANAQLIRFTPDLLKMVDDLLDRMAVVHNKTRPLSGPFEDAEAIVSMFNK